MIRLKQICFTGTVKLRIFKYYVLRVMYTYSCVLWFTVTVKQRNHCTTTLL